jgi:serine/threonine protein phosphatase 1
MKTYAIGDVHGCAKTLAALMDKVNDAGWDKLVFIGDYIDRGPNSKDVINIVMNLQAARPGQVIALKGNHEDMCLHFHRRYPLYDYDMAMSFLLNGGIETIQSFGDCISEVYLDWMLTLPIRHEDDDCHYVHAGFRPDIVPDLQQPFDLLWIRDSFLESSYEWDKRVVHGHSIRHEPLIDNTRISIDTGCFSRGTLTAVCVQTHEFIQQANIDKEV